MITIVQVENDDGIWLKLSPASAKKSCNTDSEAWTLVVHPSGRIFLSQEGDNSYKAFEPEQKTSETMFHSAASVFGTPEPSVFGSTAAAIFGTQPPPPPPPRGASIFRPSNLSPPLPPPPPPPPPVFAFGTKSATMKLAFGVGDSKEPSEKEEQPPSVFQFSSSPKLQNKDDKDKQPILEQPAFSIGIGGKGPRSKSPRRRRQIPLTGEEDSKEVQTKEPERTISSDSSSSIPSIPVSKRQALSPAVAECQRAIFAAFLWQEGLVHDAMASASYLKFHPEVNKEMRLDPLRKEKVKEEKDDMEEKKEDSLSSLLPPTLNHLVTFWDEIAVKVIDSSNVPFPPPKVPSIAQELQRIYEQEKREMEKLKKDKEKKGGASGGGGGGSTVCELCDQTFPDPVTYHMKDTHPGCGKHASGWGYNSRGSYCSGWAGNCGDGGRGGSTWYLMCKDCHSKYLQQKEEKKKKVTKPVALPKMKTRKPGKPRSLPVVSAVQGMIQNAKFLLEVACSGEASKGKVSITGNQPDFSRQISTPEDTKEKSTSLPRPQENLKEAPLPILQDLPRSPMFSRSVSVATGVMPEAQGLKRIHSDSGEDIVDSLPPLTRQRTLEPPVGVSDPTDSTLMMKPSMALAKLMYLRSRQGSEGKESGYSRVISFVMRYHDLDGLKVSMKQAMRIAVLRYSALEVKISNHSHSSVYSTIRVHIYSPIHTFVHLIIHSSPSILYPSIYLSIQSSIHLSIHSVIYPSIYPFSHLSIHLSLQQSSIHPSIPSVIYPFIYPFSHLSIHLSIHPSIHPSICPFIHLSIHPSNISFWSGFFFKLMIHQLYMTSSGTSCQPFLIIQ